MIQRADFVPDHFREQTLHEPELGIPIEQGIIVPGTEVTRLMVELLDVKEGDKCLLIGTGSGYQTAYLAEQTGAHVDSLDIRHIHGLEEKMPENVTLYSMDGLSETPEGEFYDAIMVTCAVPAPMIPWIEALNLGGRLVAPVGDRSGHAIRKYVRNGARLEDMGDFAYCRFMEGDVLSNAGIAIPVYDLIEEGQE